MLRGSGRSARGEPPETDPRFFARPDAKLGVNRQTDCGTRTQLIGTEPDIRRMLSRVSNPANLPWTMAVSARAPADATLGSSGALVLASGTVGNGGATVNVEFDCTPDTVVGMPGPVVDLTVGWSPWIILLAANDFRFEHLSAAFRPSRVDISAVASLNQVPARGAATRTYAVDSSIGAGGPWRLPVPPFADALRVNCSTDADYASITSLTFAAGGPIVQYTGAQLLAFKNAGASVPVPGNTLTANLVLAAAINRLSFSYELSL